MAIAWFDTEPLKMNEPVIRTGGLPLMKKGSSWPICEKHQKYMLFRAQMPFAVSSFGQFDDDRLILVFECHDKTHHNPLEVSTRGTSCAHGAVFIEQGDLEILEPPPSLDWSVELIDFGAEPEKVKTLIAEITSSKAGLLKDLSLPTSSTIAREKTFEEIAEIAKRLESIGATVKMMNGSPVVLDSSYGGLLAPFTDELPEDEDEESLVLPTLSILKASLGGATLRGLFGGWLPVQPFDAVQCPGGHPMKTFAQLFAVPSAKESVPALDSAVVRVCKKGCGGKIFFI